MMCSHTPETTRPIANPEKPLTNPPAKAATTKRVKTHPSIGRSPKARRNEHLDGHPSGGEAVGPHGRQINVCQVPPMSAPCAGSLVECGAKSPGEFYRIVIGPEMKEEQPRLFV